MRKDNLNDIVECTKDVTMDNKTIAFIKGAKYEADLNKMYYIAINEQGEDHCVGFVGDEEQFFSKHFVKCN